MFREGRYLVVGVDSAQTKVDLINQGLAPIIEKDVGEMIAAATEQKRLGATTDAREAVLDSEISVICVGTPSQLNGGLDLRAPRLVVLGPALRDYLPDNAVAGLSAGEPGRVATMSSRPASRLAPTIIGQR
jgi:GDP-mannose 6-dehydrogenase